MTRLPNKPSQNRIINHMKSSKSPDASAPPPPNASPSMISLYKSSFFFTFNVGFAFFGFCKMLDTARNMQRYLNKYFALCFYGYFLLNIFNLYCKNAEGILFDIPCKRYHLHFFVRFWVTMYAFIVSTYT